MKYTIMILLVTVLLVACSVPPTASEQTTSHQATVPIVTSPTALIMPTPTTADNAVEEAEIRDLVENFGKRLQLVSLLAPSAAQDIQKQYSEFVAPALLDEWMSDVSKAPGRMVSSPWPARIEITTLSKEGSERYVITGFVIEVTSTEVASGAAAARIPVQIVVQKDQGHWLLTEYAEER